MIVSQAQLTIGHYYIHIAQDDLGHVYCFKHDLKRSDWQYFDNLDLATDYIFSGLPEYQIEFQVKDC